MAAFQKFNSFVEALGRKVHNLHTDTLKVVLTNTAPIAGNTVLANIAQIANGNGYATGGQTVTGTSYAQTGGVAELDGNDATFTASGGTMGPFRYAVLYNSTATNGELIGFWDYGSALTLADGENVLVDFNQVTNILAVQ